MSSQPYYQAQTIYDYQVGDGYSQGGYYDPLTGKVFTDDKIEITLDRGYGTDVPVKEVTNEVVNPPETDKIVEAKIGNINKIAAIALLAVGLLSK